MSLNTQEIRTVLNSAIPRPVESDPVALSNYRSMRRALAIELARVNVSMTHDQLVELGRRLERAYAYSNSVPGEHVGILAAQSIGERLTQTSLNTFHKTGVVVETMSSGLPRLEKLFNASRCSEDAGVIFFRTQPEYATLVRSFVPALRQTLVRDVCDVDRARDGSIVLGADLRALFDRKTHIAHIVSMIDRAYAGGIRAQVGSNASGHAILQSDYPEYAFNPAAIGNVLVRGVRGIEDAHILTHAATDELVVRVTFRTNTKSTSASKSGARLLNNLHRKCMTLKGSDPTRYRFENPVSVLDILGVEAAREMLVRELAEIVPGIAPCHLELAVDQMMRLGVVEPFNRYTFRDNPFISTLSKLSFEESIHHLCTAASSGAREHVDDLAGAVFFGTRAPAGTGMCAAVADLR